MRVYIESLKIEAIIGVLDYERVKRQRVIVDLELEYRYIQGQFINYAELAKLIEADIVAKQYFLLEEALLGLKESIINRFDKIEKLTLKISKPDIIGNARVALSESWSMK